jgi:hypothetical protein
MAAFTLYLLHSVSQRVNDQHNLPLNISSEVANILTRVGATRTFSNHAKSARLTPAGLGALVGPQNLRPIWISSSEETGSVYRKFVLLIGDLRDRKRWVKWVGWLEISISLWIKLREKRTYGCRPRLPLASLTKLAKLDRLSNWAVFWPRYQNRPSGA